MAKRESFVLNFRFTTNAQTGTATRAKGFNAARDSRGRLTSLDNFARLMVEDVALNTANRTYALAKASLEKGVAQAIAKEISQMAKMIAKFVVQPKNAKGPKGTITAADQIVSAKARTLWGGRATQYELSNSNAYWSPRSKKYMSWKQKQRYPSDWWNMTGKLRKALANESLYKDFGPVSISFTKGGNKPAGEVKQTSSGRSGKVSKVNYQIGRLDVAVFGRIRPEMLPAIMDSFSGGINDVGSSGKVLPSLFKDDDVAKKLIGNSDQYRPVIEPFVSYFLTRAIPNAVFRRTEKLISDAASVGDRRSSYVQKYGS